ncbi:MAG: hypothetical protein Q8J89_02775 [Caulobacter sp.]|nr:hypothetical protein [Caulobacter sp.]
MIDHNFSSEAAPAQRPGVVREQMMKLGDDPLLLGARFTLPVKGAA